MRRDGFRWVEAEFGVPLQVRSPDDGKDDDDDDQDDSSDSDPTLKAFEERMKGLEKQFLNRLSRTERKMLKEIESRAKAEDLTDLVGKLSGKDDDSDGDVEGAKGDVDKMPPGAKAQFDKFQKQIDKMTKQLEAAEEAAAAKDKAIKLERRQHSAETKLRELGAIRPDQAYKILSDQIVEDDELGDAIKVKTEHGDDLVPLADYLATFKEENAHLFANPAKSGSGAGAGSADATKPRFRQEQLADTKEGGMSWDDYEKNRDKIHAEFEKKAGLQ